MRDYVEKRIVKAETPVSDTLSLPNMYTFNNRPSVKLKKGPSYKNEATLQPQITNVPSGSLPLIFERIA